MSKEEGVTISLQSCLYFSHPYINSLMSPQPASPHVTPACLSHLPCPALSYLHHERTAGVAAAGVLARGRGTHLRPHDMEVVMEPGPPRLLALGVTPHLHLYLLQPRRQVPSVG